MWKYKTPGIPDEEFERTESVPITKEEVRSIQISKARLSPGQIVLDIGCGSGSITVEAGLQVESDGKVIGVDLDPNAIELTNRNLKKFGVDNTTLIYSVDEIVSNYFSINTEDNDLIITPVDNYYTEITDITINVSATLNPSII